MGEKVVPKVETWKEDVTAHHQFISMFIANNLVGNLDPRWNSHDGDTDEIYQLHYTHMATQPWPNGSLVKFKNTHVKT